MIRVLTIIVCFQISITFAQQRPVEGIWTTINMPVSFSSRWQMHNDASYRTLGWGPASSQYLYRPGIRFFIKPTFSITAGTAFFFTRTTFNKENDEFGYEFRTWQELLKKFEGKHETEFQLRFRSEQRFFRPTEVNPESRTAHRFRLRGSVSKKFNEKWSLQLSEEYFRQDNNGEFEFDQNRIIVTGIHHLNQDSQLQLGYMWLRWPNTSQHIISIGYQKKLKLYGKQ
jgi:hypothetical protein